METSRIDFGVNSRIGWNDTAVMHQTGREWALEGIPPSLSAAAARLLGKRTATDHACSERSNLPSPGYLGRSEFFVHGQTMVDFTAFLVFVASDASRRSLPMIISDNDLSSLLEFCRQKNLDVVDNRAKNGAFWVKYLIPEGPIAETLEQTGLRFKPDRGWWTT